MTWRKYGGEATRIRLAPQSHGRYRDFWGLTEDALRLDKSRRYRLTVDGYRICVVYLKLFEKIYAPLTSAILKPFQPDAPVQRTTLLDRLYCTVVKALDLLVDAVGLKVACGEACVLREQNSR